MSFRSVFIALVIGFGLVLAAFLINAQRPRVEVSQPSIALVRATGKCAECHSRLQYSVVHEYQLSVHAAKNVTCLDCHQPATGQEKSDHHSFVISKTVTSANCRGCHESIYQQFLRSRHAAPSWAAVYGENGLSAEQVAFSEKFHPGACKRSANSLVELEGAAAMAGGCAKCHSIGKPNADGTVGACTACHTRHTSSVAIARLPTTCGQCHMGPDHSQLEIFNESRHGLMFTAQQALLNLAAEPKNLTTRDMFIPTCATCHMSGLNGLNVTHDTSERLSYWLFAEVSEQRPNYLRSQEAMKELCSQCHVRARIDQVFKDAEDVVQATNSKVKAAKEIVEGLRKEGLLGMQPFQTPLDFKYFDLWHYYGRTAKHGAFMGGADFAQWHGNYPLLEHTVEIKALAEELRRQKMLRANSWWRDHRRWVELFVLVNLAFLALDIYLAHSVNKFREPAEYLPLYFSLVAPVVMMVAIISDLLQPRAAVWRDLGYFVGWLSIMIGLVGVILHLQSHFFYERTLRSLVYAAPFAAPLAYTGLGLLLVMNRMVAVDSREWPMWVLLLALGGFFGNFLVSLTDHAQNGFYHWTEWIPVVSSAFAVGSLTVPYLTPVTQRYLWFSGGLLVIQAVV